jgi:NAD(P)-dependent dehydrogenase (short-subunit alcohol dehydrogenase family)
MSKPVCAVVGVGPGNGAAFGRAMSAKGYQVALLARNADYLEDLAAEIDGAKGIRCDVTDPESVEQAFASIRNELGHVEVLFYNAGSGQFGDFDATTPEAMQGSWNVNVLGLFHCAKQVTGPMIDKGSGDIVVTGATASLRGGANFTAFASAKAGQRSLAQSLARYLGPKGIHVSLFIVDGIIDMPRTRKMMADAPDGRFMKPDDIAASVVHLIDQPKSAWTFEMDLRPFSEKW